ncbi:hypothetical protein NE235_12910 [Actinoallomurus spadix]|uniref:Uncharacterized protein n=1 Tax=Actinoallomurus spadix TaxID=79912 RepID=A0ABP3H0X7_9ACTN|nr:hypothetical protein [Actinoallomurus spadix]MCO5987002.1 hypothetical protein [Actinoallomurus spadix]
MDLTDRQRKILFAVLVALLAAAGVILTIGSGSGRHKGSAHKSGSVAAPSPSTPTFSAPGLAGPPPSGGTYDIYSLMPFTQKDFSAAADVARRFVIAYGTYRYDEQPNAYLGRMQGLVTTDLLAQLQRDSSVPGLLDQRKQDREVSTSDAHLDSLRDMEKDQFIFLVTQTRHVSKGESAPNDSKEQYAVTVTRSGGGWVVYAFDQANVGDK